MIIEFIVLGVPQAKGSMRPFAFQRKDPTTKAPLFRRNRKGAVQPVLATVMIDSNQNLAGWQQVIAAGARQARNGQMAAQKTPVSVKFEFVLPRPKYLKDKPAPPHTTKPDFDKLTRAVCDGLTNVVMGDDSQVNHAIIHKRYAAVGEEPHAHIWIECVDTIAVVPVPVVARRRKTPALQTGSF